jgi:hypothetical protein
VTVEEDTANHQGVKIYVRSEYGDYKEGRIIDEHMLVGLEPWRPGADKAVMDADGLLDIYRAVVWEYIRRMEFHATEYVQGHRSRPGVVFREWLCHPRDAYRGLWPNWRRHWPDRVSQGVAYTFGAARRLYEFQNDWAAAIISCAAFGSWMQPAILGIFQMLNET